MRGVFGYTIRWMTLLLVSALLLLMLIGLIIGTNGSFMRLLSEREKESAVLQGVAATRLLSTTLDRLPAITRDWSSSDETYNFVLRKNPSFVNRMTEYPLHLHGLNFIIILDENGTTFFRYDYDYRQKRKSEKIYDIVKYHKSISKLAIESFEPDMVRDVLDTTQFGHSGFLINEGNLFYASAFPILQSDESGPPAGTLIFGRQILASECQDMMLMDGSTMFLVSKEVAVSTSKGVFDGESSAVFMSSDSQNVISCTPIKDLFGENSASLLLSQPRDLYESGMDVLRMLIVVMLSIGALVTAAIVLMLERIALKPLTVLSGAVREVGLDESRRVTGRFVGKEIHSLQNDINDMLARLELSREELLMNNTTLGVYSRALETTADIIILFDGDYQIEYMNPASEQGLECSADDLIGLPFNELVFAKQDDPVWQLIKRTMENGRAFKGELSIARKDGELATYESTLTPIMDEKGVAHVTAILRDITQKKKYEDMLLYVAKHDGLTGLPNRICLSQELKEAIEESEAACERLAVAHININGFKYVNDALGHAAGDELLCSVANRLSEGCGSTMLVAHIGGDEYMLLIKAVESEEQLEAIAANVFKVLEAPYILKDHDYIISVSIGSSVYPDDGIDAETLMQNADLAMHKAKAMGGNHHESYYEGLSDEINRRVTVDMSLRKAIENKELVPFFQPIVSAKTSLVTSCEALIRWVSPTEGLVPPSRFIPLASETGMIVPITAMMLHESLKSVKRFHGLGHRIVVAVNVPVQVLMHRDFMNMITDALEISGVDARYLNVEITEDTLMLDSETALARLEWLRSMGIGISVDDFGTGYSSLSYLKRLAPQRVKIDQWFIGGIPDDDENVAIVKAILALASSLGLETTAEGVETTEQIAYLRQHGCTHLQGYYYTKPLPEDQFITFVNDVNADA